MWDRGKTMKAGTCLIAALAAASVAAPASAAVTLNFTSATNSSVNGSPDGNPRSFSNGGITVTATAWSLNGSTLQNAWLGQYTHGLGVTNQGEDGLNNSHTVDNYGYQDFIILVFNQAVNIQSGTFYPFSVNGSTDNDSWISYGTLAGSFSAATLTDLMTRDYNVAGAGSPYNVNLPSAGQYGNVWLIGAANSSVSAIDNYSDGFKLASITVNGAVPEPSTWAMMLLGLGAMGMTVRRRRLRTGDLAA
jgi:hypothetical protein